MVGEKPQIYAFRLLKNAFVSQKNDILNHVPPLPLENSPGSYHPPGRGKLLIPPDNIFFKVNFPRPAYREEVGNYAIALLR